MDELPLGELMSQPAAILRRVEAGERFVVMTGGRPIASLGPVARRRQWVPAAEVWPRVAAAQADASLRADLDTIIGDGVAER